MRQGVTRKNQPHQRFRARKRVRGMANRTIRMTATGFRRRAGIRRGGVLMLVMPRMRGLAGLRLFMLAIDADCGPGELGRQPGQQENDEEFAHGADCSEAGGN